MPMITLTALTHDSRTDMFILSLHPRQWLFLAR